MIEADKDQDILEASGLKVQEPSANQAETNQATTETETQTEETSTETETSGEESTSEEQTGGEQESTTETETQEGQETTEVEDDDLVDLASEETGTESSETQSNDSDTSLSEITNGRFDSAEDLNRHVNQVDELKNRLTFLEENGNQPSFYSEMSKNFDEHLRRGLPAENFFKVQAVNVEGLSDKDAVTQDLMFSDNLTKEEAEAIIEKDFQINPDKNEEDDVKLGNIRLKQAATGARERLSEFQKRTAVSPVETEAKAFETKNQDRMNEWFPHIDDAVQKLTENGYVIPIGNGGKGYKHSAQVSPELIERFEDVVYSSGIDPDSQSGLQMLQGMYLVENKDAIFKAYGEKVRSMTDEQWMKEIHNSSQLQRGDAPPTKVKSEGKSVMDQILDGS